MHIHIHTHTCIHIYMYTYTYTYTYIHTWIHVYTHTHIHVHIHIYIYICLCTHIYISLYIYRICTSCTEREADVHNICLVYTPTCMVRNNICKCMPTLSKKMHMDSCVRAYSTVQQLLCHGGYCELILSLARTSCRLLFTARPTARSLAALRDVVRSRNPSKSTLAHDAVATAVLAQNRLTPRHSKNHDGPCTRECCFEVDVFTCREWIEGLEIINKDLLLLLSWVSKPNLITRLN